MKSHYQNMTLRLMKQGKKDVILQYTTTGLHIYLKIVKIGVKVL